MARIGSSGIHRRASSTATRGALLLTAMLSVLVIVVRLNA
jgi:hypothetical protein